MRGSRYLIGISLCIAIAFLFACSSPARPNSASTQSNSPAPAYEGFHDITNCNGILGWAWDKNRPNEPVKVELYDGDKLLATVMAEDFRQDLVAAGIGNGNHGFTYPVPPRLKDEKPHTIRMKYAGTEIYLANTSREIKCKFE